MAMVAVFGFCVKVCGVYRYISWSECRWFKWMEMKQGFKQCTWLFSHQVKRILFGVTCASFKNVKECTSRIAKALYPLCYLCSNVYEINKDLSAT